MSTPSRGEVWVVDLGMVAKVRPCLLLTDDPPENELALITVISHTTSVHGNNQWELVIPKPFLKPGAFHIQQINSVPVAKLSHKIGGLTSAEMELVEENLRTRLQL